MSLNPAEFHIPIYIRNVRESFSLNAPRKVRINGAAEKTRYGNAIKRQKRSSEDRVPQSLNVTYDSTMMDSAMLVVLHLYTARSRARAGFHGTFNP